MKHRISYFLPALLALLLLSSCSGGGVGFGSGGFQRALAVDYIFAGGGPEAFGGQDGNEAALQQLAADVVSNRTYFFGLYRAGDRFDTEVSELHDDRADSVLLTPEDAPESFDPLAAQGTVNVVNDEVRVDLAIPTAGTQLEGFQDLYLSGVLPRETAQDLIEDVRVPAFEDSVSAGSVAAQFTLTGTRDGRPFSIAFTQQLRAYSNAYITSV